MQTLVTPEQRQAAKREIIWQVEQGATASVARSHSLVLMHRTTVYRLLKRVQREGEGALTDGRHGHPVKLCGEVLTFLIERCQTSSDLPSSALQYAIQERFSLMVSISQLNRVRASLGLTRKPAQLRKKKPKSISVEQGYSEGAGGLLLLAAASETGLLTQLEKALPKETVSHRPPLAGSSAVVRRRLLLTLLFLGAGPLSINGPQNNDKKMKWLVEPIGIPVLHDVLLEEEEEVPKMRFRSIRL